jgi:hypothetical protein
LVITALALLESSAVTCSCSALGPYPTAVSSASAIAGCHDPLSASMRRRIS